MKKQLIIFGTGDIAQIANDYFERDSDYEIACFCVDNAYRKGNTYLNRPLVDFERIEEVYPPNEFDLFVALSYAEMNKLRERKFNEAIAKGYYLPNYVSPKCNFLSKFNCGMNCFILEDNTIQPYVRIGDNVTIWSGNHIGHHSVIESHNFISSHVVISGHCHIESNCFLGVNSTLAHQVRIATECIIGAGAVISKSTDSQGVYVAPRSVKLEKISSAFKL